MQLYSYIFEQTSFQNICSRLFITEIFRTVPTCTVQELKASPVNPPFFAGYLLDFPKEDS